MMMTSNLVKKNINRNVWNLFGMPFDAVTLNDSIKIIEQAIETETPCFLSTPNLNFVIQAQKNDTFYQSILKSNLVIADGMPIIWIAKLLGVPINERVAGSSLFDALRLKKRDKLISVFFFGGQGDVAERAALSLNNNSLGMQACGFMNPGMGSVDSMSEESIIQEINQAKPDFLVVSLGAIKGQEWIMRNQDRLNATVISHLGAVVNFVAGDVKRAPSKWQDFGVEWLWRIYEEPALWKRYFSDGWSFIWLTSSKILPLVIYQNFISVISSEKILNKFSTKLDASVEAELKLFLIGFARNKNVDDLREEFQKVVEQSASLVIDCADLDYIESSVIGLFVLMKHQFKRQESYMKFINVSTRVARLMSLHGTSEYLLES